MLDKLTDPFLNYFDQFFPGTTFTKEKLDRHLRENQLNRDELNYFTIPDGYTKIGEDAFSLCTSLESVNLPNGLKAIGKSAFFCCFKIKSIHLPDSIEEIGQYAFNSCKRLENIKLPKNMRVIEDSLLAGCESIKSMSLPENIKYIRELAFSGCKNMKSIQLSESLTEIGRLAFRNCSALTSICIPNSVSMIQALAFSDCENLKIIVTENQNWPWQTIGIDTKKTLTLSHKQYIEQNHPSLFEKIGMKNVQPNEFYLVSEMISQENHKPSLDRLMDVFQDRSILQIRSLLLKLGKSTTTLPQTTITIKGQLIEQAHPLNAYLSAKDHKNFFTQYRQDITIIPKRKNSAINEQSAKIPLNPFPSIEKPRRSTDRLISNEFRPRKG